MKRGFTFVELAVSIAIIAIIAAGAYLSPGIAGSTMVVNQSSNELKNVIENLRTLAVGQDVDRATNYVLFIWTATTGSGSYCGISIGTNEYVICYTKSKQTLSAIADADLIRVKAGSLGDVTISSDDRGDPVNYFTFGNPIIINSRTYDGQVGVNKNYYDISGGELRKGLIDITKGTFVKTIIIDPVSNLIDLPTLPT